MLGFRRNVGCAGLVFCGLFLAAANVHAVVDLANGWGPSPLEIRRLPDYCQTFFIEKKTPLNCDGVHHLCAGHVLMNRVADISIPKAERQRILSHAKSEVGYIFGRHNPNCAYMEHAKAAQSQIQILELLVGKP